ncbi:MAG TPA: Uma2 family endonuclease [Abditibacterium sp.]|jgi:hypothetical protein
MSEPTISTLPPGPVPFEGAASHDLLCRHLIQVLRAAFEGKTGQVLEGECLGIELEGCELCPDAAIFRSSAENIEQGNQNSATSPSVSAIFEVMTSESSGFDRGAKFEAYAKIETLSHYVLLETDRMAVEHFQRVKDGWLLRFWGRTGDVLRFGDLELEISLGEIYANLPFPERSGTAQSVARREADATAK